MEISARPLPAAWRCRKAFTLVELLVAAALFSLILAILLGVVSQASTLTRHAGDRISSFQSARAAFDQITAKLSQATLNTYWDYDNPARPTRYLRMSELHFLIGKAGTNGLPGSAGTGQCVFFQVPLGISALPEGGDLRELLNAGGFFVQYGPVDVLPSPPFPSQPAKYRYQLKQALQVSEDLSVYADREGTHWVGDLAQQAVAVSENVVHLSLWPRLPEGEDAAGSTLTDDFTYDSREGAGLTNQPRTAHQMPPVVQVTMVALDEKSAARVCVGATPPEAIQAAFDGLFALSEQEQYERDLGVLETRLAAAGLHVRIFSARVAVRESKML